MGGRVTTMATTPFTKELLLRGELGRIPGAKLGRVERYDNLKVLASTADNALHRLNTRHGLDAALELLKYFLSSRKGGLVIVRAPLEPPLARDCSRGRIWRCTPKTRYVTRTKTTYWCQTKRLA